MTHSLRLRRFSAFLFIHLMAGCAGTGPMIDRLTPVLDPHVTAPSQCTIVSVMADSPAQKAGLRGGDCVEMINHVKPEDASAVTSLIDQSPEDATMDVLAVSGSTHSLHIKLNKEKPRLGAMCDLSGWQKPGFTSAGNESETVFHGPYAFTASGIFDKGLLFLRVRIANHSNHPLSVGPELFTATDGSQTPMRRLNPEEVMYFIHGGPGLGMIKPPASVTESQTVNFSTGDLAGVARLRHTAPPEFPEKGYIEANVEYLTQDSLWSTQVASGAYSDGLVYFAQPSQLPLTVQARVEEAVLAIALGHPTPSESRMSQNELLRFFQVQKKGTPLRLTLEKGKVFIGRFSSYDALNETVWFDIPGQGLVGTASFGLHRILSAEPVDQAPAKKPTTPEVLN